MPKATPTELIILRRQATAMGIALSRLAVMSRLSPKTVARWYGGKKPSLENYLRARQTLDRAIKRRVGMMERAGIL